MKEITQYKDELIEEIQSLSLKVNIEEIIETFEEAVQDLNLDFNNNEQLESKLGSPREFINNYLNERLAHIEKPVPKESELMRELRIRVKKIYNTPFTYIQNNSISRFLVLLFPAFIIAFTLIFGNYIDYNNSYTFHYQSLFLIVIFPMYELFILLTRTHLTSYSHAVVLRNIYRGILLFGLLLYLITPFLDFRGYDELLAIWFITLISFEIIIYLQEITSRSNPSTYYFKGRPFKRFIYEVTIIGGLLVGIIVGNPMSPFNWLILSGYAYILYLQYSDKVKLQIYETSNLFPALFYGLILLISNIVEFENEFIDLFGIKFLLVLIIIELPMLNKTKSKGNIQLSNIQSATELFERVQLYISTNNVLGKIKIYYVFLFFLILELYNYQIGKSDIYVTFALKMFSLIIVTFMIIELYHPKHGLISSIMLTLERNKLLLLYFIFASWGIINSYANFYEIVNLSRYSNNDYRWIDYQLQYINLLLYGIYFGIILVLFQNSLLAGSKVDNKRSMAVVFVILTIELIFVINYLENLAFSGHDAKYFKPSEHEIYIGLFLFLGTQLLIPLINLIKFVNKDSKSIIPNPA